MSPWTWVVTRVAIVLCAFALLASSALAEPESVHATALGDQIASGRRSQAYYESAMLAQDRVVAGLRQHHRLTRRALRDAKQAVTRSKVALRIAIAMVQRRAMRLAELESMYDGVAAEEIPDGYQDRVRSVRRDLTRAQNRRAYLGQRLRAAVRVRHARQRSLVSLRRSIRLAVSRREAAETGLGAYIVHVTQLAAQRAEIQSDAWLSTTSGFTWPSVGRISQTYGCTGYPLNPRRGSCRHFHDGLDIVAGYGSRVATAADGVVAYAGWNPWDEHGRAWLMVVSHPDGYTTRYGHLLPGAIARVGQFVRQGQAIGRMGNTGRSTGTHLHFELLRGGTTVNPWTYLPAGMATIREPRRSHRHGHDRTRHDRGRHERTTKDRADHRADQPDAWAVLLEDGAVLLNALGAEAGQSAVGSDPIVCLPTATPDDDADASSTYDPTLGPTQGDAVSPDPMDPCAVASETGSDEIVAGSRVTTGSSLVRRGPPASASASAPADGVPRSLRGASPVPV